METRKLYYEDPLLQEFTATVVSCESTEKGYAVVLDATAFYPEGGGQPCDIGCLNEDIYVTDVREKDGCIVHLCNKAVLPGTQVTGTINWWRRQDLMQQHTGEHIVSGIIHQMFGCHNVGFHIGGDVIQIDFDYPIPPEALAEIEGRANEAIYDDVPIKCWYPNREELPKVGYRSKKEIPWPVRIVEIPGYDKCACCGVHVTTAGQIGLIKRLSCVKFHQGVRIEMLCGFRAFRFLSQVYEQNKLVSQAFSAKLLETGAAAQKMNEALAAEKFRAAGLERQLYTHIAAAFAGKGDVVYFAESFSPAAVRELADRIAQECGGTAAVFSGNDEAGYSVWMVNKNADISALGKEMNTALSGRGGGKPGFFQGSVKATRKQIEAFFQEHERTKKPPL